MLLEKVVAGDLEGVRQLIGCGVPLERTDKLWQPLHSAALHGHYKITCLLLSHGASPNYPDEGGNTPLHYACLFGHLELALLLLDNGAILSSNSNGLTPLQLCINPSHITALQRHKNCST